MHIQNDTVSKTPLKAFWLSNFKISSFCIKTPTLHLPFELQKSPYKHQKDTTPKYFTEFCASITAPLQVMLKSDCDFNLGQDPNSIDSVLPKCRESLLSTSHLLTISSSFCKIGSMLD